MLRVSLAQHSDIVGSAIFPVFSGLAVSQVFFIISVSLKQLLGLVGRNASDYWRRSVFGPTVTITLRRRPPEHKRSVSIVPYAGSHSPLGGIYVGKLPKAYA
jgi:hypothetical protein